MNGESPDSRALIQSLFCADKKIAREAANALIPEARRKPELAARLEGLLKERRPADRWPIAYVLGHTGTPSPPCLQVFRETLDCPDPDLRWGAVSLLSRLAAGDTRIPEMLLDCLRTGTPTQRRMAIYGLRDSKLPDASILAAALLTALEDGDPMVRVAAALTLRLPSAIPPIAIDSLLDLLSKDPDSRVRCAAASTLAASGISSKKVTDALKAAAQAGDPRLKKTAETALELIKKGPPAPK